MSKRALRSAATLLALFGAVYAARVSLVRLSAPAAVIGEIAVIEEVTTGMAFTARVDTGAKVSSIHVDPDDVVIEDASTEPTENIDKVVRLRLDNGEGDKAWIETRIDDYAEVRSANGAEHRYQVVLPLKCGDVLKHAAVTLNDRSDMTYRFLLGRDFLAGNFLVDVANAGPYPGQGG